MERIRSISLTDHPYQMPLGSKNKSWHPSQETKLLKDGRLKMTLKVADNDELVGWILSLGGEVRVIRPEPFKARI